MKTITIISLFAISILTSCIEPFCNCLEGNGNIISETRSLNNFSTIESEGSFDVEIIQDSINEVIVDAPSNLIEYVETEVNNGTLVIRTKPRRCIRETGDIHILVKTDGINKLKLSGSGNISAGDLVTGSDMDVILTGSGNINIGLVTSSLDMKISGSGDISISGSCYDSDMEISGSGEIHSYGLNQQKCFATITGSGNMFVNAEALLDIKITGSGNIYYLGNPAIQVNITGSGDVINAN